MIVCVNVLLGGTDMADLIKRIIEASDNNDYKTAKTLTDELMEVYKNGTFNK